MPELVDGYFVYFRYQGQLKSSNSIDLSGSNWIDSVTAFLLANLKFSRNVQITAGSQSNAIGYFNTIATSNPEWWKSRSYRALYSSSDSYLPFSKLPKSQMDFATLTNAIEERIGSYTVVGGKNAFMSVLGELTDNIYQHSNFTSAFMMCQVYRTKRYVGISFIRIERFVDINCDGYLKLILIFFRCGITRRALSAVQYSSFSFP